jgi:hypothetical protein
VQDVGALDTFKILGQLAFGFTIEATDITEHFLHDQGIARA